MSPDALLAEIGTLREQLEERDHRVDALEEEIAALTAELAKSEQNRDELLARIAHLVAVRQRAPTIAPGQEVFDFGDEEEPLEKPPHVEEAPDGETEQDRIRQRHRPKRPARAIDTSNLPVEHVHHELEVDERICPLTGKELIPVDDKVEEEIVVEPSRLKRLIHHRVVYGLSEEDAKERESPRIVAPAPPRPLEESLASASLLALVLTQKYLLHLPLYRQEQELERQGLRIPRQTLCDWVLRSAWLLRPVSEAVFHSIRDGPDRRPEEETPRSHVMQIDDTPILCQGGKGRGKYQAYLWTFVSPCAEGIAFRFTDGRAAELLTPALDGFEGILVGDGYSGNAAAARKTAKDIRLAGCWAHAIRKFKEARKETPEAALFAADIRTLFRIEQEADRQELEDHARLESRRKQSRSVLARILWRLRGWELRYDEAGKMAEACKYVHNQRRALRVFLEHGRVPIDNNRCERAIRPIAVGRRNWLFTGSERGGHAAATIYTLIASCREADVNPFAYLEDVLVRIATHPASKVTDLMPARWKVLFGSPGARDVDA